MRGPLVIALCASGCFSDRGVAIEVDVGDTGATAVELYIGSDSCDKTNAAGITCATIAPPPDGRIALRGDIWFRDALLPDTVAVKGHTATFELKATTATMLPIVIAVGTVPTDQGGVRGVGTATLSDLAIPVHNARVITTTLVSASPALPARPDAVATEDRVLVWTKQTPPSSCLLVEHWANGQASRVFIVPASDPDCDDVEPECNAAAYHGTSSVGGADGKPDCITPSATGACVLGSFGCVDGAPRTATCLPQHEPVCVPSQFCGCDLEGSCTQGKVDAAPTIPRVVCSVPLAVDLTVCAGLSADVDLSSHYPTGDCGQPELGSLQAAGFGNNVTFNGAELEVGNVAAPCKIAIKSKSGMRTSIAADDHGVIRLETRNGALLVPLVLKFTATGCVAPLTCVVMGDDANTLWTCAP